MCTLSDAYTVSSLGIISDAYIKSMATHRLNKMFVWEHTLQTFEAVSKPIQNFLNNNLIMVNLTNGTVFT